MHVFLTHDKFHKLFRQDFEISLAPFRSACVCEGEGGGGGRRGRGEGIWEWIWVMPSSIRNSFGTALLLLQ